jgi:hypothetical protein
MNPDELAARLNDLGYEPLLATIKALDPDLFEVIKAVGIVRSNNYGTVTIEVYRGKITQISHTLKKSLNKE